MFLFLCVLYLSPLTVLSKILKSDFGYAHDSVSTKKYIVSTSTIGHELKQYILSFEAHCIDFCTCDSQLTFSRRIIPIGFINKSKV